MKKARLLTLFTLVLVAVSAGQLSGARRAYAASPTFTDIGAGLTGVYYSSVAWGDYNSDGSPDILLTGYDSSNHRIAKIYKNNGNGTFSEDITADSGLTPVSSGSVAWGDYNSDGKPDILLTGANSLGPVTKIYKNNGNGSFSEDSTVDAGLAGVSMSSVAWGDYNSDGKPDILLTGYTGSSPVTKIYKNNGDGSFSEDTTAESGLTGVYEGSVAWGDHNSDGKPDILLTGYTGSAYVSKVYTNNGNGTFSVDASAGLVPVYEGEGAWDDYNSDGKADILLTGYTGSAYVAKVYKNNGSGSFSEDTTADSGLTGVGWGSVAWGDYNSDGKPDIVLTGSSGYGDVSTVYQNQTAIANTAPSAPTNLSASAGSNQVTLFWNAASDSQTPAAALTYNLRVGTAPGGSVVVSPLSLANGTRLVPQDGNVGERTSYTLSGLTPGTTYYWSVQAVDSGYAGSAFSSESTFTYAFTDIGAALTGVRISSVAWGDYNSDGRLDILLTGYGGSGSIAKIYKNNGDGSFSEDYTAESDLTGVYYSSVAWGDYNSDGKPDILLTGYSSSGPVSKIYKNNGNGTFSRDTTADSALVGVYYSSVAWGDYNSDGKPDILFTGYTGSAYVAKIYKNNGNGSFSEDTSADACLTGVYYSSVAWGDYNSDGKPDILLTGLGASAYVAKIYKNNGNGTFSEDITADSGLTPVSSGSVAWGDYNSDGKPDILLTGATDSGYYVSKIYKNNGNGTFSEDTAAGLPGVFAGSVAWGDYNSDGKPDILLTGYDALRQVSKIYKNNGNGTFSDAGCGLTGVYYGSAAWGDYNSDGRPDILFAGDSGSSPIAGVYQNRLVFVNTAPSAPSNLSASFVSGVENLSWAAASDWLTPAAALTYNLRVGTTPGGSQIVSPLSLANGTRLVPKDGNVGERTSYGITGLAGGTYYWSVQAVDSGFAGSPFASEGTFTVPESFALSSSAYYASEGDGTATVTINRTGSTVGSASVHVATADGTATAGSDYTAVSQTVTFAAGESSKTVSIPITDDSLAEGNETVSLSLTSPSTGATLGTPSSATLTIVDNDRAFAFSLATYSVGEAGPSATVTINRIGSTVGTDSVHFATANGTATAGSDYTAVSQTVSFSPGETQKTVSIPITDDSLVEGDETVSLTLSSPSTGAQLGSPSTAALTIVDNDTATPPPTQTTSSPAPSTTAPATTTATTPTPASTSTSTSSSGKVSGHLTKTSFKRSEAAKVKLLYSFSPKSRLFAFVLSIKKGSKWVTLRSVRKTGSFKGAYSMTVKQIFGSKPIKPGSYRLKLTADANSKLIAFRVT